MDMYGVSNTNPPDIFQIDDLLDFSNQDLFSSSTSTTTPDSDFFHYPPPETILTTTNQPSSATTAHVDPYTTFTFADDLGVPNEDVAELEWLSQFVDDSFSHFPVNELATAAAASVNFGPSDVTVPGKARSKRNRAPTTYLTWDTTSLTSPAISVSGRSTSKMNNNVRDQSCSSSSSGTGRKCTHCASEKTPQWRTGPMGPKTLCNACGVRFKSGRLVPEYRPAASPTFTLTQHSNSHRKVMELRRQKERRESNRHEYYHRHQQHDFKVC